MMKAPFAAAILSAAILSCAFASAPAFADSPSQKPNVIVLLADDLGWTGLGCFGSDLYETPNLDRLALDGMKFTNAYAACTVCSPTRASIMTGMYPARLHLTDFIAGQNRPWAKLKIPTWTKYLEHERTTIAEALNEAGYVTAQIGKWHLDDKSGTIKDSGPTGHGFQIAHGKPPGTRGYYLSEKVRRETTGGSNFLTDYLTDRAIEVIDDHKDQPFFLYFAYHTPHTPIQGREDLVKYFRSKVQPDAIHTNPVYAAMVKSLDQSVGRIVQQLEHHEIDDRTILIFLSDNGGLTQRYGKRDLFTENIPLRRGKGSAYEGGVRVPCIVRWPGVTEPGSQCDRPIISNDLYPTILSATQTAGNESHHADVDGMDLSPLMHDPTMELDRDLFWHYPHYHAGGDGPYSAIRSGDYRLIEFHEDQSVRLYDLSRDIGEKENLAVKLTGKAAELRSKLAAWRSSIDAQMPTVNPDYNPSRETQIAKGMRAR